MYCTKQFSASIASPGEDAEGAIDCCAQHALSIQTADASKLRRIVNGLDCIFSILRIDNVQGPMTSNRQAEKN
jgi:hypothetical protein